MFSIFYIPLLNNLETFHDEMCCNRIGNKRNSLKLFCGFRPFISLTLYFAIANRHDLVSRPKQSTVYVKKIHSFVLEGTLNIVLVTKLLSHIQYARVVGKKN